MEHYGAKVITKNLFQNCCFFCRNLTQISNCPLDIAATQFPSSLTWYSKGEFEIKYDLQKQWFAVLFQVSGL